MSGRNGQSPPAADPAAGPVTRVAVVIPTHARPELLRRALQAVVGQSRTPDTVVVVDDTGAAAPAWFAALTAEVGADTALVWHARTGASGASASRNAGAALATGADVLAFCDDDDVWSPRHLERAIAALTADPAVDLAVGRLVTRVGERRAPRPPVPPGLTARDVVARNPGMTGSNPVLRRAAFDRVGGFDVDLPVFNDLDLLVRLLLAGCTYRATTGEVEQHRHAGEQLTTWNRRRADGIRAYARKHRAVQGPAQRLALAGQVAAVERRIQPRRATRLRYLAVQLAALRPAQVVRGVRRRRLASADLFD